MRKTTHLTINNADGTHRGIVALTITPTPGELTAKLWEVPLGGLQRQGRAWIGTDTAGTVSPEHPTMLAAASWLLDQSDTAVLIDQQLAAARAEQATEAHVTNLENRYTGTVHTISPDQHSGTMCRPGARTTCGQQIHHDGMEWTGDPATCNRCTRAAA